MPSKLTTWFPFSLPPQIISAPMLGVANARLACAVSLAGGIGFIPAGFDFSSPSSPQLVTLEDELITAQELFSSSFPSPGRRSGEDENGKEGGEGGFLQIGVGFILSHPSCALFTTNVIPLLRKYKPRAIWLFAPHPDRPEGLLLEIINAIHQEGMVVFFQVGTVHEAKSAVRDGADVVVAQGVDAGGHQSKSGSGVVSLVPEVRDAVGKEVVVVGAGGVSDGRGVAGVLAAGRRAFFSLSALLIDGGRKGKVADVFPFFTYIIPLGFHPGCFVSPLMFSSILPPFSIPFIPTHFTL